MATLLCHTKNNFWDGGGGWEFGLGYGYGTTEGGPWFLVLGNS